MPTPIIFKDSDGNEVPYDRAIQIHESHHDYYNHLGQAFILSGSVDDLDKDATFDNLIQVGDMELHMLSIQGSVSGLAHGYIYEGTTFTNPGSAIAPVCANRIMASKSTTKCSGGSSETSNMAITDVGSLLVEAHFAADQKRAISTSQEVGIELTFAPHKNYLIRIDNEEAVNDIQVTNQLIWIEKIPRKH